MSATGRSDVRRPFDQYVTPSACVEAILPHLGPLSGRKILEPSAGTGAIVRVLLEHGAEPGNVWACELDPALGKELPMGIWSDCRDFLQLKTGLGFDLVIGNPPYAKAQEFVEHAIACIRTGGTVAMLLRLAFLASRKRVSFHQEHPSDLYVLSRRPSFTGGGTDSADYGWFVWGPGRGNRWFLL